MSHIINEAERRFAGCRWLGWTLRDLFAAVMRTDNHLNR